MTGSQTKKFGKPMITAKNTNTVKHLHHKPRHRVGLDGRAEVVDNLLPPVVRGPRIGGS
jgi:hypothetical protein